MASLTRLEALSTPAVGLDETAAEDLPPLEESELLDQASSREELARRFRALDALGATSLRDVWCERSVDTLTQALSDFDALVEKLDGLFGWGGEFQSYLGRFYAQFRADCASRPKI